MAKKSSSKPEEKHQGILDKLIHGDNSHDQEVKDPAPPKPKPVKKVSDEGASSESKHQHRKFDKFK